MYGSSCIYKRMATWSFSSASDTDTKIRCGQIKSEIVCGADCISQPDYRYRNWGVKSEFEVPLEGRGKLCNVQGLRDSQELPMDSVRPLALCVVWLRVSHGLLSNFMLVVDCFLTSCQSSIVAWLLVAMGRLDPHLFHDDVGQWVTVCVHRILRYLCVVLYLNGTWSRDGRSYQDNDQGSVLLPTYCGILHWLHCVTC